MEGRGYTLIDFACPRRISNNLDLVVRLTEYVRRNFYAIVPGVPSTCELYLLASGHAHNPGDVPLLGLYTPPELIERLPDSAHMIEAVSGWCAALTDVALDAMVLETSAATWADLQQFRVHPIPHDTP